MAWTLLSLPNELLERTLVLLDIKSLLRCSLTCKRLRCFYTESALLQLKYELALDGLIQLPGSSKTSNEQIEAIRTHRTRWTNLSYTHIPQKSVDPGISESALCDFAGGSYYGLAIGRQSLFRIPMGPSSDVPVHSMNPWDPYHLEGQFVKFILDPVQDLLVLWTEVTDPTSQSRTTILSLRSLSTGKAHPEAASPDISYLSPLVHYDGPETDLQSKIELQDNVIAICKRLHYQDRSFVVMLCDWRAGIILATCILESSPTRTVGDTHYSMSLLSSEAFAVLCMNHTGSSTDGGSIRLYRLDRHSQDPVLTSVLHLPQILPNIFIEYASIYGGNACGHYATGGTFRAPSSGRAFAIDPGTRIQCIHLDYRSADGDSVARYCLYVHTHRLLELMDWQIRSPNTDPKVYEWSMWAPARTRLILEDHDEPGEVDLYTRGQRALKTGSFAAGEGLVLFDFAPGAVRAQHSVPSKLNGIQWKNMMVTGPSTEINHAVFAHPIVTSLPYRHTVVKTSIPSETFFSGFKDADELMMDEESIIQVYDINRILITELSFAQ